MFDACARVCILCESQNMSYFKYTCVFDALTSTQAHTHHLILIPFSYFPPPCPFHPLPPHYCPHAFVTRLFNFHKRVCIFTRSKAMDTCATQEVVARARRGTAAVTLVFGCVTLILCACAYIERQTPHSFSFKRSRGVGRVRKGLRVNSSPPNNTTRAFFCVRWGQQFFLYI